MLKIKEIKTKTIWEKFLNKKQINPYPFFQSWNWGEVQKRLGFNILRLGIFDKFKLIGVCLIIDIEAKRGHYLHLRHGPVFLEYENKYSKIIFTYIKKIAKDKNISFIRTSPLITSNSSLNFYFKKNGFIDSPVHNMDAETSWVLKIDKSEEDLLKEMRKTHRYLIKKAINSDIEVICSKKTSDVDLFLPLYRSLSEKKGFVPHQGIKEEFEIFSKDNQALLFFAKYNDKIISAAMIIFLQEMAIYHHGASLEEYRHLPSAYLLQWQAILEAKKRGKKFYNFWGISPLNSKNHPWSGLTLFKTGFGGYTQEFIHAKDFSLNISYWKTYLIEYISKKIKGY